MLPYLVPQGERVQKVKRSKNPKCCILNISNWVVAVDTLSNIYNLDNKKNRITFYCKTILIVTIKLINHQLFQQNF